MTNDDKVRLIAERVLGWMWSSGRWCVMLNGVLRECSDDRFNPYKSDDDLFLAWDRFCEGKITRIDSTYELLGGRTWTASWMARPENEAFIYAQSPDRVDAMIDCMVKAIEEPK